VYALGVLDTDERIKVGSAVGTMLEGVAEDLKKLKVIDRPINGGIATRIVNIEKREYGEVEWIEKRLRQAFSSIGGKRAIAKKLITLFPEHRNYVEAFAGGAAVYFAKQPSEVEVLSDMTDDVIAIYRGIQQLDQQKLAALQSKDWIVSRERFNALRDYYRAGQYVDDVDHLYTLLYLRHAVFGSGDPSKSVDISAIGRPLSIINDLPEIQQRLQNTKIVHADARKVIQAFDAPDTFFYLDPPYPVGTGERKDYNIGSFTMQDMAELFEILKKCRGQFLMSIPGTLHPYVPEEFAVNYIETPVLQGARRIGSQELVVSNYELPAHKNDVLVAQDVHIPKFLKDNEQIEKLEMEVVKSEEEQRLVWVVVMKPYFVDKERQWAGPDAIMKAAHSWMLKGAPVWLEHLRDISDRVKTVESYTLLEDLKMNGRTISKGAWIAVLWVPDDLIWKAVKGPLKGGSVRGPAEVLRGSSPPPALTTRAK
jgi:DNA adenine methylase